MRTASIEVRAQIWAETESQKGILIGKGGRMVRDIGTAARKELERELGTQVFLDLKVRVREQLAPRRGPARPARDRLKEPQVRGPRPGKSHAHERLPQRGQRLQRVLERRAAVTAGGLCLDDH